jgi:hypothetical protein
MIAFQNLNVKVVIGLVLGVIAALIVGAASWNMGEPRWLNCLVSLFGALLGWWFGILASPGEQGERRPFSEFGKTLIAFVGGFLFAKTDSVFDVFLVKDGAPDQFFVQRVLLLGIAFCLGALFTFLGRKYVGFGNRGQ